MAPQAAAPGAEFTWAETGEVAAMEVAEASATTEVAAAEAFATAEAFTATEAATMEAATAWSAVLREGGRHRQSTDDRRGGENAP
jgi:hypothetical protein